MSPIGTVSAVFNGRYHYIYGVRMHGACIKNQKKHFFFGCGSLLAAYLFVDRYRKIIKNR